MNNVHDNKFEQYWKGISNHYWCTNIIMSNLKMRPRGNNDSPKCMAMKGVVTKCKGNEASGDQIYFIVTYITKVLMIVTKWDSEVVTDINIPQQNNNINGHYLVARRSYWQVGWWRVLTSCPSKVWPLNHCHWITKSFPNIMVEN